MLEQEKQEKPYVPKYTEKQLAKKKRMEEKHGPVSPTWKEKYSHYVYEVGNGEYKNFRDKHKASLRTFIDLEEDKKRG